MQGTQYTPRESILCMEHFVALQGSSKSTLVKIPHFWESHVTAQIIWLLGGLSNP